MSKYKLSSMQQKMFIEVALYLKNNPTERICSVNVKDFYEKIGINTNDHNELYGQMRAMLEMVIHIPKPRKKGQIAYIDAPMFASIEVGYDQYGRSKIEIEVSEKLKPYFIEIADGDFFSYKIENTRKLKSHQSIKMYLYLRSWARLKKHTILYSELRDILSVDLNDYKLFADFRKRVLDKCQAEIHDKTDLRFDYELIREIPTNPNTPVYKISFLISGLVEPLQLELPLEPDELYTLYSSLETIALEEYSSFVKRSKATKERLKDCLLLAQAEIRKGNKIRSLQAFIIEQLKQGGATGYATTHEKKKQQHKALMEHRAIEALINQGLIEYKRLYLIEIGKDAPQHEKDAYFKQVQDEIKVLPALNKVWKITNEWNLDALREGLGAKLNTKSDDELATMYMESIAKPVVKEDGLYRYL